MKPLKEIVGGVQTVKAEAKERVQSEISQAETALEDAQRNIALGTETTRSKLHDGLIVLYGKDLVRSPQIVENYERVADQLKGKRGQPVVLIHRWTELHGCTGFGGKGETSLESAISVGILKGTNLVFDYDQRTCALPTSRHAETGSSPRKTDVIKDRLVVSTWPKFLHRGFDLGLDLDREIRQDELDPSWLDLGDDSHMSTLTVAIGNEGIANWLSTENYRTNKEFLRVRSLCHALGIKEVDPATDWQKSEVEFIEKKVSPTFY